MRQQIFSQIFQGTPENKQIIVCSFVGCLNELFIGALYCDLFCSKYVSTQLPFTGSVEMLIFSCVCTYCLSQNAAGDIILPRDQFDSLLD